MRLIDADALLQRAIPHGWSTPKWVSDIAIEDAPTIDAVSVVRCKDCKFNYANQIPSENVCQLCVELPISKDFYCADGEREDTTDEDIH